MKKKKWFNQMWLQSEERIALLQNRVKELEEDIRWSVLPEIEELPYKNLIFTGKDVTVVLNNFNTLTAECDVDKYQKIKAAKTEDQILSILYNIEVNVPQPKKSNIITSDNLEILRGNYDFEIKGTDVYLVGVNLVIPNIIVENFIEILEKMENTLITEIDNREKLIEEYEALKMFWMWTALNPIESSRNDLFSFIKHNEVNITKNGLLEMYRRVVSVGDQNKELTQFISENYYKVKKQKKSPANYFVHEVVEVTETETIIPAHWRDSDWDDECQVYLDSFWIEEEKQLTKTEKKSYKLNNEAKDALGNLKEMYLSLPELSENTYTDAHTGKKSIKVGQIYEEDEDKIDLDNKRDCSRGLHVGSHTFMFSGFGDTGVLALVNPMYVRSVPVSEANKMRVKEMFIAATLDIEDYKKDVEVGELNDYSDVYANLSLDTLKNMAKTKSYVVCQEEKSPVEILDVVDILSKKIVNI